MHVKIKTLRLIKHCCLHGHATFKKDMKSFTAEVKECLSACAATNALAAAEMHASL